MNTTSRAKSMIVGAFAVAWDLVCTLANDVGVASSAVVGTVNFFLKFTFVWGMRG